MYLPLKRGTYRISSGYRTKSRPKHRGIDFSALVGTPIYAPFDGRVIQGKERAPGSVEGFFNWVWIEGISEPYDFIVGHMRHSSILVKAGDHVKAGQKIAEVGNEGKSTGPHAHCELWTRPGRIGGHDIDPTRFWGDNAPSPGGDSAPAPAPSGSTRVGPQGTIFGIDISGWQKNYPMSKVKADGMKFVIIRLCDGTYQDPLFKSHLADAEKHGLLVSTYWYLRAPSEGSTIAQQVDVIDRQLGGRKDLGVWIDVESVGSNGRKLLTKGDVWAAKRELERRGYYVPGIYSGAWYWEHMPGGEPSMDGLGYLWVSNYGRNRKGDPRDTYAADGGDQHRGWSYPLGDRKPDILQFGSEGVVGDKYPIDVNAFKGSVDQLREIFTGRKNTSQKGPLMALSSEQQDRLFEMVGDIHHELTHRFQTRVRDRDGELEPFRDTLIGFVLETDRKIEDMHKNMLPAIWQKLTAFFGKEK
ncbi:peptidoglycan DD-metalloendopeptidase family protein [Corynebacterium sp. p3-SID1194]|uniref:peptidoglycan DD-metalloendopeptidase family protein n=1 Tax=Corynebacterium sp. p3-SID1194 TaxID=2916105 RepID=UPI0021A63B38|nr:peptidoglycan DD-metalloendopeptidase family protein [Corynebacterium sp. p3-SID1194]MCT1450655.1 peptidoglycan DD-metalloendopeptidase family protein [Corynebacterium sp. p3-SID1194]